MRASLASLLVTSLVLSSALPAFAGGKKGRPKKGPKKKASPAEKAPPQDPAPTPEGTSGAEGQPGPNALGDPAEGAAGEPPAPSPAPQTPAPAPTPAPAGPPPGSPQAKAKAKVLQKEATKLYNVQQYMRAAELYQEAYLLDANPAYLYASAQSQRLAGDCEKALLSYQSYLRTNPAEGERAKAQANIERCEQDIREREAAVTADQVIVPIFDVPPPPPPPQEEKIVYVPPPPLNKTYIFGHILLGVGVVGLGGGAYLFYTGRKTLDDHNNAATYDDYVATLPDLDVAKRNQKIGVIAAASGGALIGGAILFYVLHSRSRGETPPPPVDAAVTSEGATLTFTGKF